MGLTNSSPDPCVVSFLNVFFEGMSKCETQEPPERKHRRCLKELAARVAMATFLYKMEVKNKKNQHQREIKGGIHVSRKAECSLYLCGEAS